MSNVKVFKKGEVIFKEGDKAQTLFLIQSGSVDLQVTRNKSHVSLYALGANQVIGEHALSGVLNHPHTAVAAIETKAIELPIEAVRTQVEGASQILKYLLKGAFDKIKLVGKEHQSLKLERDSMPCPPEQTAKIFGTIYHVAKAKAEASGEASTKVSWPAMKQYAQRVFLESPRRLEMAVNIFVKLGLAKYELVKNEIEPGEPDEVGFVHFSDLGGIEQFFEFYQYYYFKGGKQELLKTDDRAIQFARAILASAEGERLDRHGSVRLDYPKVVEKIKEAQGLQLSTDNLGLLEKKGLFVKRSSSDDGVFLQFEPKEFDRTIKIWMILREVERWNENGYVDPSEPVEKTKKAGKAAGPCCPNCAQPHEVTAKFCAECGHKIAAAA